MRWWIILLIVAVLLVGGAVVLRKLSTTEEARLKTLRPEVRDAYLQLRAAAAARGVQMYLTDAGRTEAEQAAEFASGTSGTNDSWHELGRAVDFNVQWTDPSDGKLKADHKGKNVAGYKLVHELAPTFGFRGIPRGSPFNPDGSKAYIKNRNGDPVWDVFHLEYTEGMTFAQALKRDRTAA